MHDNNPEVLEVEKQRNLAGKQHETSTRISRALGWSEELATSSEAYIRVGNTRKAPNALDH